VDFNLSKVIINTTTCVKRRRVSTHIDPGVPIPIIEALMVAFLLPQLPTLLAEAAITRLFTRVILEGAKYENTLPTLFFIELPSIFLS
jgi:hypothetical protein